MAARRAGQIEDDAAGADLDDGADDAGADERAARRERRRATRSEETINLANLDPDELVEITVGGRTIEIAASELGDFRRREHEDDDGAERRAERREAPRRQVPPAPPAPKGETAAEKQARLEARKKLVARIQYGEEDDAAAALEELENSAVDRARSAIQNDRDVQTVVDERRSEIAGAMAAVEKDYRYVVDNPDFLQGAMRRAVDQIHDVFKAINLKEADQLGNLSHLDLINAYVALRQVRPDLHKKMPKIDDVFLDAADAVDEQYVTDEYIRRVEREAARAERDNRGAEGRRFARDEDRGSADGTERRTKVREHERRLPPARDIETRRERKQHLAPQPRSNAGIRIDARTPDKGTDPASRQAHRASVIDQMRERTKGVPLRGTTRH